ncbi:lipocalin-like domain-containing protein [Pseudonocardia sp. DSM 110487]|uniref:lipocalin-like domain-containing protein n=1 Tax=Pseudonocardia sp. DSM 110487 TaxID=2865833 RepID=UPI001C69F015|nr:lipocalin-like domain-containing protein [Pseudonocardia sp. DSM 110487]QYN34073.1 lipocalin-like domain-containing protein [Pseudonocardia sp. DSM 110487]
MRELIGVWRLRAYTERDEDGVTRPGPLGERPDGLLIYEPTGFMSVSMMAGGAEATPESFMGYAGRWQLRGTGRVVHLVAVSAHPQMVGTAQEREFHIDGDALTLTGAAVISTKPLVRALRWERV